MEREIKNLEYYNKYIRKKIYESIGLDDDNLLFDVSTFNKWVEDFMKKNKNVDITHLLIDESKIFDERIKKEIKYIEYFYMDMHNEIIYYFAGIKDDKFYDSDGSTREKLINRIKVLNERVKDFMEKNQNVDITSLLIDESKIVDNIERIRSDHTLPVSAPNNLTDHNGKTSTSIVSESNNNIVHNGKTSTLPVSDPKPLTLLQLRRKQAEERRNHTNKLWGNTISPNNLTLSELRKQQAEERQQHTVKYLENTLRENYKEHFKNNNKTIKRNSRRRNHTK